MPIIELTQYTDPYCTWCWGSEPIIRKIEESFGDQVRTRYVMGGLVKDPQGLDFTDVAGLDLVGVYGNYAEAEEAWRDKAQRTVDDAEMKYVVVHLHRLLQPDM